ncbi:DUF5977 domain-containing protein [Flavobacterium sp. 2]|uniref:DUF5977 domain-containing protein n=1 Tax=Flavobacterium sp. 2 TaxID=308053 RepID=UPI003CED19EF
MEKNTTYKPFAFIDNYVPTEGETIYYNIEQTLTKTKNDCTIGIPSSVTLTAEANKFVSNSSIEKANEQAEAWLKTNTQAYANNIGVCMIDNTPPSSFVLSASVTSNTVVLSWTASTDNIGVIGYDIFIDDTFLASTSNDVLQYIVDELSSSTIYSFYVKAKDTAGNSSNSNLLAVKTLPVILNLPVTKSVIFENRNTNWDNCRNATTAQTYYQSNNLLGAAKDTQEYILNRYRATIDTLSLESKPKSAKLKFRFASNAIGNALTFHLFATNNVVPYSQNFQLEDWNDWDMSTFIGSTTFPTNSTEYGEIELQPAHLDLLNNREGFNFFLISNGDKENNAPTSNSRPTLSMTPDTGEIYLECEL